ncbi:MAG: hypothetical protein KC613_10180 [Myxococcales bacterium]|nr:hypothetical protein [Myxococcales bacterium]MCB9525186.1 hypothetical protein [Myxococcales bacterium]
MRPSFLIMLAVGLGLMGWAWYANVQVAEEKAQADAPIVGCKADPGRCPSHLPVCLTDFQQPTGVCSAPCQVRNQCPEHWCCPPPVSAGTERLCVPRLACAKLGLD